MAGRPMNIFAGILTVLLLTIGLTGLPGLAGLGGEALAQDRRDIEIPSTVLSFALLDTLVLPTEGKVAGLTWLGTDTLVILADLPDTLSESGDREVRLVFQDSTGTVIMEEDFSGVLDRGLAWDESKYRRVMHRTTVAGDAAGNPWRVDAVAE